MKLKIELEMSNSAFEGDRLAEVARILLLLLERLPADGPTNGIYNLHDSNGNWVGKASIRPSRGKGQH